MSLSVSGGSKSRTRGLVAALLVSGALVAAVPAASPAAAAPSAAPCIPAGHGPNDVPSILFGRKGGNIRPMQVSIFGDGTIRYVGGAPLSTTFTILPAAVFGLQHLARAEGFSTWPSLIKSTRLMLDAANLYVTLRAGCSTATKTVTLQAGASSPAFSELFDTLLAATAQST